MKLRLVLLCLLGLLGVACGATSEQLQTRAAFDLQCNKGELQITELDRRTRGVRGCGQQATYVESCNQNGECSWVLNSDAKGDGKSTNK